MAGGAGFLLAGCGGPLSTLDPAGPAAGSIATLWWIMLLAAGVILAGVMALLITALVFPGRMAGLRERRFIVTWGAALPLAALCGLLVVGLRLGEAALFRRADVLHVEAQAERWGWSFRYPDAFGAPLLRDRLLLPVGRVVEIRVTSRDVIHSLWVPQLGGKIDAIPGRVNRIRLLAEREGEFGGICAEYCGPGHAAMLFEAVALPPPDFAAALRGVTP